MSGEPEIDPLREFIDWLEEDWRPRKVEPVRPLLVTFAKDGSPSQREMIFSGLDPPEWNEPSPPYEPRTMLLTVPNGQGDPPEIEANSKVAAHWILSELPRQVHVFGTAVVEHVPGWPDDLMAVRLTPGEIEFWDNRDERDEHRLFVRNGKTWDHRPR